MDDSGEVLKTTTTNKLGEFRFTNIAADRHVYLRLEIPPDEISEKPTVAYLVIDTEQAHQQHKIENIYFDFDLYALRPEAKIVLNDLAAFFEKYSDGTS